MHHLNKDSFYKMKVNLHQELSNPYLEIDLEKDESIRAEAGSMMFMTPNIDINTNDSVTELPKTFSDTLAKDILSKALFRAIQSKGKIAFAPPSPGGILEIVLKKNSVYTDGVSFLAATPELEFSIQGSLRGLLAGKSIFLQKVTGYGNLYLKYFGSLIEHNLQAGESIIVDAGHLVAYEESVSFKIQKPREGRLDNLRAGEWIICKYIGPGKVWLQTRNRSEFAKVINRYLSDK